MPLLGRHKSLPGSPSSSPAGRQAGSAANASRQPVCESPLFGVRRQLPINSAVDKRAISPGGAPSATMANQNEQHQQQPVLQKQSQDDELGSIPRNITRQQIHYAFSIMDTNSDGLIDLRDLSQMLANLGVPIDEAILSHVMSSVSKRGKYQSVPGGVLGLSRRTRSRPAGWPDIIKFTPCTRVTQAEGPLGGRVH